jgi:putative nucleotidyltransferase with HDIG domain
MLIGQRYRSDEDVLIRKDGSSVYVSIMSVPLYDEHEIVGVVVIFHDNTKENQIRKLEYEKLKNQDQIIHSMIDMIEARDSYTAGHTKRVAKYCELIAREMNYSQKDIEMLKNSAWLHDIGKISTPDSILLKPGKLDDDEYFLIKDHLSAGYEMLNKIDQYKEIAEIMHEHHEKFDGSGYPNGLKAQEIKPLSRIMIVADAFDAMTTNRVYKPKKSVAVALQELENLSAKQFHPEVVSAAVVALKDIKIDNDISQLPQTIMEQQRFSYFYKDRLTNLFIIEYLNLLIRYHIRSKSVYTYDIKLRHFSKYNKKYGWNKGDQFLIDFSNYLLSLDDENLVFRVEGDDFMIISTKKIDNLISKIEDYPHFKDSMVRCNIEETFVEDVNSLISS